VVRVALGLALLLLAGCGPRIPAAWFARCEDQCKARGGVSHVDVGTFFGLCPVVNCVCADQRGGEDKP